MRRRASPPGRQRGMVLIIVLWVAALLALVASAHATDSTNRLRATQAALEGARAEAAAEAMLWRTVFGLAGQASDGPVPADGEIRYASDGDLRLAIRVEDLASRVDLNRAGAGQLQAVLLQAGAEAGAAERLADAVLDWRDRDSLRRVHGAEREDYVRAGLAHGPGNRYFAGVEELQLVLGMDRALYERVSPFVTTHAGGSFEITVSASAPAGVRRSLRAVVRTRPGQAVPYAVLEWDRPVAGDAW